MREPMLLPSGHVPMLITASSRLDELIRSAHEVLNEAVKTHKLTELWAAFSGGQDSIVMAHLVSQHPLFRGVFHIDTLIGIKKTRLFVENTCKRYGWRLIVKMPATTYPMLTIQYAFPGPPQHSEMYKYLKERPMRQCVIAARKGNKKSVIGKVGGMRSQESARRKQNTEPINKGKEGVWISPIHNWTKLDCLNYIKAYDLPRSEVWAKIHRSGDCNCGAFAEEGEMQELELWFPEEANTLKSLQKIVRLAKSEGILNAPQKHCQWGHGTGIPEGQLPLLPMCWNCSIVEHNQGLA